MITYVIQDRRIQLRELHMSMTYGGLLAGFPNRQLNEHLLRSQEGIIEEEAKKRGLRSQLILPAPIPYQPKPDRSEERLPEVMCWGVFDSDPLNKTHDVSSAVYGWYQDEVGMPVFDAIKGLMWEEVAKDCDF